MKFRWLLILAALAFVTGVIWLLVNKRTASEFKNQIIQMDQAGEDATAKLNQLKLFSYTHTNATAKVELTYSYQRAVEAANKAAAGGTDGQIYAQAQAACASRADSITQSKCVTDYISTRSKPGANPQPPQLPSQKDYIYEYKSPLWTTDGAGLSLLTAAASAAVALWLRFATK